MDSTPEKKLLKAILKQAVKDYIKLNPESNLCSAEFFEDEGKDYKTAEDFLFGSGTIQYGAWELTLDEICLILDLNKKNIKYFINRNAKEYG